MIDLVLVLSALTYATAIAIGSVGVTIIYSATKTFNFVHSSMIGWGCYTIFTFTYLYGGAPQQYLPLAFLVAGGIGILTYFTVNRWLILAKAPDLNLMMSTLGMDLIMYAFLNMFIDYLFYERKISIAKGFQLSFWDHIVGVIHGYTIRLTWIAAPILLVMTFLIIYMLYSRTRLGIAMRATIENTELAQIQGINPDIVYSTSWFIGGGLAGVAGGLLAMMFRGTPSIGMDYVVAFFAGAIVGGLESIYGGFLGGMLVGLSEYIIPSIMAGFVGSWIYTYRPVVPLILMVITLLVQPMGLGAILERR